MHLDAGFVFMADPGLLLLFARLGYPIYLAAYIVLGPKWDHHSNDRPSQERHKAELEEVTRKFQADSLDMSPGLGEPYEVQSLIRSSFTSSLQYHQYLFCISWFVSSM